MVSIVKKKLQITTSEVPFAHVCYGGLLISTADLTTQIMFIKSIVGRKMDYTRIRILFLKK